MDFKVGEYIVYVNGDRYELGRIKSITEDSAFVAYHDGETGAKTSFEMVKSSIEELPTAEPKVGRWFDHSDEGYVECPFCRSLTTCEDNIDELHYCFNCGAKMERSE